MTAGIVMAIVGLIFGVIGAVVAVSAFVSKKKAQAAVNWPVTTGKVLSVEVKEKESYDTNGITSISYQPVVQYTYDVMGRTYTGSKIAFGANTFDHNTANKMISPYSPGSMVSVHYNPSDPAKAVLETAASGSKVLLIVGIVFAVLGVMSACIGVVIALLSSG